MSPNNTHESIAVLYVARYHSQLPHQKTQTEYFSIPLYGNSLFGVRG
jgi:hypothetical protein